MQRFFRPPAGILAARFAGRKAAGQQTIAVQRVKISKRRYWYRSFLFGTAAVYTFASLYGTLKHYVEREYDNLSAAEKKQLEKELDEEEPIYITLPFTTKQVIPPPYKGSDPEWQTFIKISEDRKLLDRIRMDLANLARATVEKHPVVVQRCGNNMKVRRFWLDIDFPSRPPPTYENTVLAYDFDSGFHLSTEPVDSLTVMRLKKILWPSSLAQSTWAFTSSLVKQNIADVSRALGFEPEKPVQPWLPNHPAFQQTKQQGPLPSAKRQMPDGGTADGATAVSKSSSDRPATEAESGGKTSFVKDTALAHINGMRQISDGPWREFRKKLAQTWKATPDYPPRGCIIVSGFVEVETDRGFVTVDIWSHWNPKTEKFDTRSMWMNVRRIQMKTQAPARA